MTVNLLEKFKNMHKKNSLGSDRMFTLFREVHNYYRQFQGKQTPPTVEQKLQKTMVNQRKVFKRARRRAGRY